MHQPVHPGGCQGVLHVEQGAPFPEGAIRGQHDRSELITDSDHRGLRGAKPGLLFSRDRPGVRPDVRRVKVLVFSGCKSCVPTGSIQLGAIGAVVEVTKRSEPGRLAWRKCSSHLPSTTASMTRVWPRSMGKQATGRRKPLQKDLTQPAEPGTIDDQQTTWNRGLVGLRVVEPYQSRSEK